MISDLRSDIEIRREKALELSSQVRRHLAAGGKFSIGDSPAINPDPAKRSETIDPTTILKRRKPPISRAKRNALRKIAEAL
ncbi:hypothetical protein [Pseudomonas sp.]|uniref:hypothetical protein n=1 Tax=Pseudomonas sp. TaxID=306 RepID=UPI002637C5DB|nr:hypothetical protein [Pseudomonas sp.]